MTAAPARPTFFDLSRWAGLSAAATLTWAQPLFTLVLENPDEFPASGLFHLWVLAWTFVLPVFALAGIDTLLERRGRGFRAWRAVLCAGIAVSLLRQAFLYYPRPVIALGLSDLFLPLGVAAAALAVAVTLRHPEETRRYLAALGLLALLLLGTFAVRSGVWGPAWASAGSARSPAGAPRPGDPPVFVAVFDELSMDLLLKDGEIDARDFPHFAAFARENAWFADATSNHMYTRASVPSMLTGRTHPGPDTPTVFHALSGRYDLTLVGGWTIFRSWTRRCARDAMSVDVRGSVEEAARHPWTAGRILARCFVDVFLRGGSARATSSSPEPLAVTEGASPLNHVDLISEALARPRDRGHFLYWHSPLPHAPFQYDAQGRRHDRAGQTFEPPPPSQPAVDPRIVWENYREQTRLVDALFGRFIAVLRETGQYERAVIFVTSDHGARTYGAFQPPGYPERQSDLTPRVPLLARAPGIRPGRHEEDYQHVDLTPTLLDLLGARDALPGLEGISLLAPERPPRPKVFFQKADRYVRVSPGLWKRD